MFQGSNTITDVMDKTVEAKGKTCMHFAAAKGDVEIFKYLVEKYKPNLTKKDSENHTPFMTAVSHKNLDLVKYLVDSEIQNIN